MKTNHKSMLLLLLPAMIIIIIGCAKTKDLTSDAEQRTASRSASSFNDYYWYKGEKIPLTIDKNLFYISSSDSSRLSLLQLGSEIKVVSTKKTWTSGKKNKKYWKIVQLTDSKTNSSVDLNDIYTKISPYDIKIAPVINNNERAVATSDVFYVQLKENDDIADLEKIAKETGCANVKQVPYMPTWYQLEAPAKSNGLRMANFFYETKKFKEVDPGFIFEFRSNTTSSATCIPEPLFSNQWGLQNSNGIDIKACSAWGVTLGDPGVVVAVVDEGIDQAHQEFATNYSSLSLDIMTNTAPSVLYGSHGTHVGGIIGANQNNKQVSGIAPSASLLSISHDLVVTSTISAELASAISYAWQNGADIINNSWGDQAGFFYGQLYSAVLDNAITNALTLGRGGLGTIVVFASGNWNTNMDYPANSNPQILAVGAINSSGNRASFSSFGTGLDIVAPGDNIISTIPGQNVGYMSGTSMAAPYAAGVAALILSVNPSLTQQQVTDIIEQTAQKVGSYPYITTGGRPNGTWHNEMGYGLLNAFAAVSAASGCSTVYYNGQTVNTNTAIAGCRIESQNVTVNSGAKLTFTGIEYILINSNFEVKSGAEFEAGF